jgi:hypothetical protein
LRKAVRGGTQYVTEYNPANGRMADESYGGFALAIHHKRSLKTVMFRNIIGLLEMAVCSYLTI